MISSISSIPEKYMEGLEGTTSGPGTPLGYADRHHSFFPSVHFAVCDENGLRNETKDEYALIRDIHGESGETPRSLLAVFDEQSSSEGAALLTRRLPEILAARPGVRSAKGTDEGRELRSVEEDLKVSFGTIDREMIQEAQRIGRHIDSRIVCALVSSFC